MSYEARVTKSGYNALTETDPNNYIFHSLYNTFKILAEGSLSDQTIDADPKTISVAHNQDFTPTVFAFAEFPDGYVALPNETDYGEYWDLWWKVTIDSSNINFIFYRPGSNYNVDIKYYIFETPAD